jgi:organic radical activating enzyme
MNNRIRVDKLEFYITNVCNLTCSGCNRYNNYKFAGWQDYADYADEIKEWAKRINLVKPMILGGEPLLNPTINQWLEGIRAAWPDGYAPEIVSNGTRIDQVDNLYETCLRTGSWVGVSLHREQDRKNIFNRIRNFLTHPIQEGPGLRTDMNSDYQFIDINGVQVHVWTTIDFIQNNIIERPDGTRTLWRSDPAEAHRICPQVLHKNYHMIRGKIYKCGPAPLMAEFDLQYPFDITDEERAIINMDQGLSIEEFDRRGAEFFLNIDKAIPQCRFCPDTYEWHRIEFSDLKPNKI